MATNSINIAKNKKGLSSVRAENMNKLSNVQNEEYVYEGETDENGIANGLGKIKLNGAVIQGSFVDGQIDGDYLISYPDNNFGFDKALLTMHKGRISNGYLCGDFEKLRVKTGYYKCDLSKKLRPTGLGFFIGKDNSFRSYTWNDEGRCGDGSLQTEKGSEMAGEYFEDKLNGLIRIRFCNGDYMTGYAYTHVNGEDRYEIVDTLIYDECVFRGDKECPDPVLENYWYWFVRLMETPDSVQKTSVIETVYARVLEKINICVCGMVAFKEDGIHVGFDERASEFTVNYPYRLKQEDVDYIANRFLNEYADKIYLLEKSGKKNRYLFKTSEKASNKTAKSLSSYDFYDFLL